MTDWDAALDSEIFRNYVDIQLKKSAEELEARTNDDDVIERIAFLENFEKEIKASPKKLAGFKQLQKKFITDDKYTANKNPLFVESVLLLNLDD